MKKVNAVVRMSLGVVPDNSTLQPENVLELLGVLPFEGLEVEPVEVYYTDIDTGLVLSQTVYGEEGNPVNDPK
jgi:hypothetical protein